MGYLISIYIPYQLVQDLFSIITFPPFQWIFSVNSLVDPFLFLHSIWPREGLKVFGSQLSGHRVSAFFLMIWCFFVVFVQGFIETLFLINVNFDGLKIESI